MLRRENMMAALKRVRANDGAPGVDGMSVDELPGHLKEHWASIRRKLEEGTYQPSPVKLSLIHISEPTRPY